MRSLQWIADVSRRAAPQRLSAAAIIADTFLFVASLVAVPTRLQAANQNWSGNGGNGNWSNISNWSGSAAPGSTNSTTSGDTATFNANLTNKIVTIDSATQDIGSILFDTASAAAYTIGGAGKNGGNALRLSAGGSITVGSSVVNTETINAPLLLERNYTFANDNSTANLIFNGGISDDGPSTLTIDGASGASTTITGLLKDGAGALALAIVGGSSLTLTPASTGSNFSGGVFVNNGTLILGTTTANALGTGPITLGDSSGSASATFSTARQVTLANDIVARAGSQGTLTVAETNAGSANNLTLGIGTFVTLGSGGTGQSLTVAAANGSGVVISGVGGSVDLRQESSSWND